MATITRNRKRAFYSSKTLVQYRKYAYFDGVNDYLLINTTRPNITDGSIDVWVRNKPVDEGSYRYILGVSSKTDTVKLFGFRLNNDGRVNITLRTFNNPTTTDLTGWKTVDPIPVGDRVHVAMVATGSTWTVYVNGVPKAMQLDYGGNALVGKFIGYLPGTDDYRVTIGCYNEGSQFMHGSLYDLRIWDKALTQAEVQQAMATKHEGAAPNLYSSYLFDGNGNDSSGNGRHATPFNGVLFTQEQI